MWSRMSTLDLHADLLLCMPPGTVPVDRLSLWVHPEWTGAWYAATRQGDVTCFNVHYAPERCVPGSMEIEQPVTMHKCLKLQFFSSKENSTNLEFRFGTYLDLEKIASARANQVVAVGLWNANECDSTQMPMKDMALICIPRQKPKVPDMLWAPQHWDPAEHYSSITKVGDYLADKLQQCDPHATQSMFSNQRSFARDFGSSALFPDLHQLYLTNGTTLPPVLGCYLLQNAMLCHQFTHRQLEKLLAREKVQKASQEELTLLLRLLRDTFCGWTLCKYEGKYVGDKCCGQDVEDQPHKLAFNESCCGLVGWDDCEGFNQFIQQVSLLFMCMAASGEQRLRPLLEKTWDTLFVGGTLYLESLMLMCISIGDMLRTSRLTTHMCVGTVSFAQFGVQSNEVQAHSYGMLIYQSGQQHLVAVLEATGWENSAPEMGKKCDLLRDPAVRPCTLLTQQRENHVYSSTVALNNVLLFEHSTDKGASGLPWPGMRLGASLQAMEKGIYHEPVEGAAVCITVLDLLRHFSGTCAKAKEMVRRYERARQSYKEIREWTRPPSKTEADILLYMKNNFGPLKQAEIATLELHGMKTQEPVLLFSCLKVDTPSVLEKIGKELEQMEVSAHDFMQSTVFVVTEPMRQRVLPSQGQQSHPTQSEW